MIVFLAKVFEKKEHAEAFLKGSMYANRLSHFKKLEGAYGRGDDYEGVIMPPLDDFALTLEATDPTTGEVVDSTTITGEDLAAPVIMSPEWFDHFNVFCMYAARFDGLQEISRDNLQDLKRQLDISEDFARLGEHTVLIKNTTEFIRRVKLAAEQAGYRIYAKLVSYYDPEVGTPPVTSDLETIFNKRKEFEYQNEFRFAIDTNSEGRCHITLDVGEIDDIAFYVKTSEIDVQLHVATKSDYQP